MKSAFSLLLLFVSISCVAHSRHAQITFGSVPPNKFENGKLQSVHTTREAFINNARLISSLPDVTVREFSFSILPKGDNYFGPFHVKGAELPADLKAKILTFPEGKIFIEAIKVLEADGMIRNYSPIIFSYNN